MKTTLSTKGQVVLPKGVRDRVGWKPGASLDARVTEDGEVVLRLLQGTQFERLRGMLAGSKVDVLADLLTEHQLERARELAPTVGGPSIEELKKRFWREEPDPVAYDIDENGNIYRIM